MSIKDDSLPLLPTDPRQIFISTDNNRIEYVKNYYIDYIKRNIHTDSMTIVRNYHKYLQLLNRYIPCVKEYKNCLEQISDLRSKLDRINSRFNIGLFAKSRKEYVTALETKINQLSDQLQVVDNELKQIEQESNYSFGYLKQIAYDLENL